MLWLTASEFPGGRRREAWATKLSFMGKLQKTGWPFSPSRVRHSVCVLLGLRLCFPKCCLLYPDQRENLTDTWSPLGRATGEISLGYWRCLEAERITCFPTWTGWWPETKGVEETCLHLSDSAGDRGDPTVQLSTGVCLVYEEARTQWVCPAFSFSGSLFPRSLSEQPGAKVSLGMACSPLEQDGCLKLLEESHLGLLECKTFEPDLFRVPSLRSFSLGSSYLGCILW